MIAYVFEPRDPLVLRDGRLAADGVPMRTLPFPWPSSLAGMVRTRIGQNDSGAFVLNQEEAKLLFQVKVAGPWLAELDSKGGSKELYFPTPADCMWHADGPDNVLMRRRLTPIRLPAGVSSDLPEGLEMVGSANAVPNTKSAAGPAFFSWNALSAWLSSPVDKTVWDQARGLNALPIESRTHVSIDPESGTAVDGQLFSTEGLCFVVADERSRRQFGLVITCDDSRLAPKMGIAYLGGERRFGLLRKTNGGIPTCPPIPRDARRLRLVLATPGIFKQGFRPDDKIFEGQARLVAAAVGRPQGISGWDFAANGPKASQRMAPAGSVFWVELSGGQDARAFAEKWWLESLCDDLQARRDGFGLCLVGVN